MREDIATPPTPDVITHIRRITPRIALHIPPVFSPSNEKYIRVAWRPTSGECGDPHLDSTTALATESKPPKGLKRVKLPQLGKPQKRFHVQRLCSAVGMNV